MSNLRPMAREGTKTAMEFMVDRALSPERLHALAHPRDWPDNDADKGVAPESGALPRATWDAALGDVARDILCRPSRRFRARMCEVAWRLADGAGDIPAQLPALIEVIHAGSLIVDDIEDGSTVRRGAPSLHLIHGMPRALNTGNWMYFWAMDLVDQLALPTSRAHEVRQALSDAMYRCHLGQSLDLSVSVGALPRPWVYRTVATSTMLKTGALMELAARLGAQAAAAAPARVEALARFGRRLGLGLQMLDDFGNLNAPPADAGDSKALEDLRNGRPTWPWARAALDLDDPTFAHLQASARALVQKGEGLGGGGGGGAGTGEGDTEHSRARALAAELRMAVGLAGRRQTSSYLRRTLHELREVVGDREELVLLASEMHRLEDSYG